MTVAIHPAEDGGEEIRFPMPTVPLGVKDRYGDLEIDVRGARAYWKGKPAALTLSEFRIVQLLIANRSRDVAFREIYDAIRGPGFSAGQGEDGYKANVRTFIKRIRQKFCEIDDGFKAVVTYKGFGYRWVVDQ